MANNSSMLYIDTDTARVKLSEGVVPFTAGFDSDDSEDDITVIHDFKLDRGGGKTEVNPSFQRKIVINNQSKCLSGHSVEHGGETVNSQDVDGYGNVISPENDCGLLSSPFVNKDLVGVGSAEQDHPKPEYFPEKMQSRSSEPSPSQLSAVTKSSDIFNNGPPQAIPSHLLINSDASYKFARNRFNPFNQTPTMDGDHFSDDGFHPQSLSHGSSSPSSFFQLNDDSAVGPFDEADVFFAELGLAEDHFSHPQGHFGLSGVEELELAIDNCKDMIREAGQGSEKQKNLVLKLVQLRIKLQELKDGPEQMAEDVKVILSHKMIPKSSRTSKYYCERCNGVIWGMVQYWYKCSECGYRCHEKCLQQILRTCAKVKVLQNEPLNMEICPKDFSDLASQSYRCAECRSAISFKQNQSEPRLCDYTGRYFCEYCHWNDTVIIPARVLHNWDFCTRKVSRSSKQFLRLMQHRAVIRIQDINPMLFVYVNQLNEIKKLREEMMVMKKYIISCPSAMVAKLLLLLEKRQHFVECSDRYSMQDLLDAEEILLPELVSIHSTWAQHIKVDCELCKGRGFCCELCTDKEILFPFDNIAVVCAKCSNVLHRHCFAKKLICPRCERRDKRTGPDIGVS